MQTTLTQLIPLLEVARALSVSPHTVRSWVKQERLRPTRVCRRLLFSPDEIARFIALESVRRERTS